MVRSEMVAWSWRALSSWTWRYDLTGVGVTRRPSVIAHLDGVDELELHHRLHLELVFGHDPAGHPSVGGDAEEVELLGLVVTLPVHLCRSGGTPIIKTRGCYALGRLKAWAVTSYA